MGSTLNKSQTGPKIEDRKELVFHAKEVKGKQVNTEDTKDISTEVVESSNNDISTNKNKKCQHYRWWYYIRAIPTVLNSLAYRLPVLWIMLRGSLSNMKGRSMKSQQSSGLVNYSGTMGELLHKDSINDQV